MTPSRPSTFGKYWAAAVAAALVLQPLGAYAAPITTSVLAEKPLQGSNPVKSNIMFTLDDSASMNDEYLPDFVGESFSPAITHCRYANPALKFPCGRQIAAFPGVVQQADPPIRSSDYNWQFYSAGATYVPGKRDDGTDLPCEGSGSACAGPWTAVYVNGFAGYPDANTGGTTNLTNGYPDTAWCNTHAASPPSAADLATAFGDGSRCRLNGRAYAAFTEFLGAAILWTAPAIAAGYNYPNVKSVATGIDTTCGAVSEDCVYKTPVAVAGNPYYYTISKVQYCSNQGGGGFGTPPCQDRWDKTTYKYVRYGADAALAFDPKAFTRVDIKPAGFLVNGAPAANPSGRSYAEEMANFAEWYAFYRTRMLSMKTAGGRAFSALGEDNARVGFHTLWENASATAGFLNVAPFDSGAKSTWFKHFYAVTPVGETPLPDAAYRIGEYFSNSGKSGLPGATDPLDPVMGKCQANYHLLSTDGYWNIALGAGSVGNQDATVPGSLPGPIAGFTPGSPFPPPYNEGALASSNSLADLAMHYWVNDIRPTVDNKVQDTIAPWQHVTLYGLSIGAQGSVDASGLAAITAGTKDWPKPLGKGGTDSIDDLWHAALNSRGKYFNAANPQQLAESIVSALADFTGPSGTGTAVGIAGPQITSTKSDAYLTSYDFQLSGDVKKYALDPLTGVLPADSAGNPIAKPLWSASDQLDAQVLGTGWDSNRRILTINDSSNAAVPFRSGKISAAQLASLNAGWSVVTPTPTAQDVLNYLRGDKSNEGVGTTNFRVRTHALGSIVYSGAVAVGAPVLPYGDTQPGYSDFAAAKSTRTPMVYVGANDGMLHALIDAADSADAGKEAWAYVPKTLFVGGNPNDTKHTPSPAFQLGALSYRIGGIPTFEERFYVNATPRIWDIDFANTNTSKPPEAGNDWRTILVGGLGAGGRAVYALDVTTPVSLTDTEADIASSKRVLWEFTDPQLGYVYDPPTLVKTKRYGWVVLVTSGYNNPGGKGFLWVLNPTDGKVLTWFSTDIGTDAEPSGLSTIRAYTASRKDPYVLQAYAGDLKGNVWRFDLSDPDEKKWKIAKIAKLADASGKPQPITTGVRVEIDQNNNVDRYLFVGTGKLLGPSDIADASVTNSLYVIRDGTMTAAGPVPAKPYSRDDLNSVDGSLVTGFTGPATGRGWYQDASDPTQKIGTDVFADVQTVVFSFSKPQPDPCLGILASTLYARDFVTGSSVLTVPGGAVVPSVDVGEGVAGIALIQSQGGTSASCGDACVQVTTFKPVPGKGQVFTFGIKLTGGSSSRHRVSWRTINKD